MGAYSEKQGERFHQDIMNFEQRCQGQYNENMIGDYIWGLLRERTFEHKKKVKACTFELFSTFSVHTPLHRTGSTVRRCGLKQKDDVYVRLQQTRPNDSRSLEFARAYKTNNLATAFRSCGGAKVHVKEPVRRARAESEHQEDL
ncbi:hypothetical protein EVAR_80377_1 [Eumeta japonica]|uniref:Uncharacterized protein n=1 Tax=Eumeta variegata TaxID=151549 RepID=A0A4C1VGQ0_EUMVA|nr:hypothetical protein EVAR_80377_1 [Eumeta japonica]